VLAFKRYREARPRIVAIAFVIFSAMSILALAFGFLGWDVFEMSPYLVALNIGILLCLYLAMLKR
jgi:peptidoglycan/LPS O-acetylase OafA/YrhL